MSPSSKRVVAPTVGVVALVLIAATPQSRSPAPGATTGLQPHGRNRPTASALPGLGTWVDLWDAKAWRDPAAAVKDMADHGVRTIYIQTGSARSSAASRTPRRCAEFITEAHARDMFVVAWYLPNLKTDSDDSERVVQAIDFTTADGQTFDSFALDIESTAVKPFSQRNRNLAELSRRIRDTSVPTTRSAASSPRRWASRSRPASGTCSPTPTSPRLRRPAADGLLHVSRAYGRTSPRGCSREHADPARAAGVLGRARAPDRRHRGQVSSLPRCERSRAPPGRPAASARASTTGPA